MTIKQQGGIFGRNPTFNDVDVEGTLTTDTFTAASVTTESISTVNTDATSYASSSGSSIQPSGGVSSEIRNDSNGGFSWLKLRTTNSAAAIGYISYYNQGGGVVAGNMAFGGRTGSSSYNERMSLDMADGDLTLNSGNLVIGTSGKGIDFSATSGTGTSELFDDYEEGTWTPVIADATSGGNTSSTSATAATYTKIGNTVVLQCNIQNIDTTGMTSGNDVVIRGLPYVAKSLSASSYFTGSVMASALTFNGTLGLGVEDNFSHLYLTETSSGSSLDLVTVGEISSGSTDLWFSLTYMAA